MGRLEIEDDVIDYAGFAFPKGKPAVLARAEKRTQIASAEKRAKADVMARDKKTCRVCGRPATEVHEALTFKSRGGVASLENSIAVCAEPKGRCHQLMQAHQIRIIGKHCSNPLIFEMREPIAARIFGRKARPAHVRILGGAA